MPMRNVPWSSDVYDYQSSEVVYFFSDWGVTSYSIAWWLKAVMEDAGIEISIYHQGATCSKAARAGITTKQINTVGGRLVLRRHLPKVLSWKVEGN